MVAGILAFRANIRFQNQGATPRTWSTLRVRVRVFGIFIGACSLPLTYWMGYPIDTPKGVGRIVGIPFFVAFFDSAGRDFVGPITMLGALGNCVFWFLLPQIVLFVYAYFWRKKNLNVLV